jgi:hypothetical protein
MAVQMVVMLEFDLVAKLAGELAEMRAVYLEAKRAVQKVV